MNAPATILSAILILGFSNFARAEETKSADHVVHVKGKKAQKLVSLFEAAKAFDIDGDQASGAISITCRHPNGPNPTGEISCDVQSSKNPSTVVKVENGKAHKLLKLMGKVNAISPSQDSCGMGSCYLNKSLALSCTSSQGANSEKDYACDVGAAQPAKS